MIRMFMFPVCVEVSRSVSLFFASDSAYSVLSVAYLLRLVLFVVV
jgi:hypothetical protein